MAQNKLFDIFNYKAKKHLQIDLDYFWLLLPEKINIRDEKTIKQFFFIVVKRRIALGFECVA